MKIETESEDFMENTKHTAGPWIIDYLDTIKDSRGITLCHVKDSLYKTGSVGGVFNSADYREERNANARLIAAAPEMLAALESAYEYLMNSGSQLSDATHKVACAIAKARGES